MQTAITQTTETQLPPLREADGREVADITLIHGTVYVMIN